MVVVMVVVVVVVSGRVDTQHGAEGRALGGGGAGLVGPGVVGEPLGGDEVLAGGVVIGVHVAPLSPGAVHSQTVTLHHSVGVSEGEAAALTAAVDQGRGRLDLRVLQLHRAGCSQDGERGERQQEVQHRQVVRSGQTDPPSGSVATIYNVTLGISKMSRFP